jgi:hypothetical protein
MGNPRVAPCRHGRYGYVVNDWLIGPYICGHRNGPRDGGGAATTTAMAIRSRGSIMLRFVVVAGAADAWRIVSPSSGPRKRPVNADSKAAVSLSFPADQSALLAASARANQISLRCLRQNNPTGK